MKTRLILSIGLAVGYLLGAKAGRARYEWIMRTARRIAERPEVQSTAGLLQAQASNLLHGGIGRSTAAESTTSARWN